MKTFPLQYKIILILTVVFVSGFIFFGWSALGDTILNLTLQRDSLDRGLVAHWTMDGEDFDYSSVPKALDRSDNSNNGRLYPYTENGLVGYWPHDDEDVSGSTSIDRSGNNNDGTITGVTTGAVGKRGESFDFDGTNDYVSISDSASFDLGSFSFSFWVKLRSDFDSSTSGSQAIVGKYENGDDQMVFVLSGTDNSRTNGSLYFKVENLNKGSMYAETTQTSWTGGQWYHVAGTFDTSQNPDKGIIYINGSESGSGTQFEDGANLQAVAAALELGRTTVEQAGSAVKYLDGSIDDARIYDRALSASEVEDIYNQKAGTGQKIAPGKIGQGLEFNGLDDYVDIGNAGSGIKTVSFWVKANTTTTNIPLIDIDGTDQIETDGSSKIVATSFSSPAIYVDGTDSTTETASSTTVTYSTAGTDTFNVPADVTEITVKMWGAGGGAGGNKGAGGGGGGFAQADVSVNPGETLDVRIGGGGGGGADRGNDGDGGGGGGYSGVLRDSTMLMQVGAGGGGGAHCDDATHSDPGGGGAGSGANGSDGVNGQKYSTAGGAGGDGGTTSSGGSGGSGVSAGNGTSGSANQGGNGGAGFSGSGGGGGSGTHGGGRGGADGGCDPGGGGGGAGQYGGGGGGGGDNDGSGGGGGGSGKTDGLSNVTTETGSRGSRGGDNGSRSGGAAANTGDTDYQGNAGKGGSGSSGSGSSGNDGLVVIKYTVEETRGASVSPGEWHHVVITDTTGLNASAMNIGRIASSYFGGTIDDVRLYDRVLPADEIERLYNLGATTKINTTITNKETDGGLVAHYTFDGDDFDYTSVPKALDRSRNSNDGYPYTEDGLVGYWSHDTEDVSGSTSVDRSGNSNDGTINGATTGASGKIKEAFDFDGSNDWIDAGNDPSLRTTGNITISAWIKTTASENNAIYTKWDDASVNERAILFAVDNSGSIRLALDSDGTYTTVVNTYSSNSVGDGAWHHVVGRYDGSTAKVYVDGVERGSNTYSSGIYNTPTNVEIGSMSDGSEWFFNGTIDDVRIYDRALSASEIEDIYNQKAGTGQKVTPGKIGQALEFDGVDDYVEMNSAISGNHDTISLWFNPSGQVDAEDTSEQYPLLGLSDALSPMLWLGSATGSQTDETLTIFDSNTDTTAIRDVITDGWHHVVAVWNGSTYDIYLDGEKRTTYLENSGAGRISNAQWQIGARTNNDNYFKGQIDDVRIYNKALSADEVKRLYNLGATTKINTTVTNEQTDSGLLGHWTFDGPDISGSTITDRSNQGNNGTGKGGASSEVFSSAGTDTFTVPAGVTEVTVKMWGAGGGAGGNKGAGGGGGGFAQADVSVNPGETLDVRIGGGGGGGADRGNDGDGAGGGGYSGVLRDSTMLMQVGGGGGGGGKCDDSSSVPGGGGGGSGANGADGNTGTAGGAGVGGGGGTTTSGGSGGAGDSAGNGTSGSANQGGNGGGGFNGSGGGAGGGTHGGGTGGEDGGCDPGGGGGGGGQYGGGGGGGADNRGSGGGGGGAGKTDGLSNVTTATGATGASAGGAGAAANTGDADYQGSAGQGGTGSSGSGTSGNSGLVVVKYQKPLNTTIGKIGQALEFDGVDDYVDVGDLSAFESGDVTYSAWVRYTNADSARYVVAESDGTAGVENISALRILSVGIQFIAWNSSGTSFGIITDNVDDGNWHHLTGVKSGTQMHFYVDGEEVGSKAISGSWTQNSATIGALKQSAATLHWDGDIDDVRIYNKALSTQEIQRLYRLGR